MSVNAFPRSTRTTVGCFLVVMSVANIVTFARDCDGNGVNDAAQLRSGDSDDCDGNGVLDECDARRVPVHALLEIPEIWELPERALHAAVGDLDGDDRPDFGVSLPGRRQLAILFNEGDRAFSQVFTPRTGADPRDVRFADVDHDGFLDVVVANVGTPPEYTDDSISFLRNDGSRGFAAPVQIYPAHGVFTFGDFDGDGDEDLAAVWEFSVRVAWNDGEAGFSEPEEYVLGGPDSGRDIVSADLDRDGIADIVVGTASIRVPDFGRVAVLLGASDRRLDLRLRELPGPVRQVAIGDFDGDSALDVAVSAPPEDGGPSATSAVLWGDGSGEFDRVERFEAGGRDLSGMASGDIDDDGDDDLVLADFRTERVRVFSHVEGRGVVQVRTFFFPGDTADPMIADFDDDGSVDLALLGFGVGIAYGKSGGLFRAGQATDGRQAAVVSADFDGSGEPDFAALVETPRAVRITFNDGATLAHQVDVPLQRPGDLLVTGDFDGDESPDLVAVYSTPPSATMVFLMNDSAGNLSIAGTSGGRSLLGDLGAADLDGDGDSDLAAVSGSSPEGLVVFEVENGAVIRDEFHRIDTSPAALALADWDGDGDVDIVIGSGSQSSAILFVNAGDATFEPSETISTGSPTTALAVGDADNDGDPDLANITRFTDELIVVFNPRGRNSTPFAVGLFDALGNDIWDVALADLDSDLRVDFVITSQRGVGVVMNHTPARLSEPRVVADVVQNGARTALVDFDRDGDVDIAFAGDGLAVLKNETPAPQTDCNGNAILDVCEDPDGVADSDENGVPDICEGPRFHRGDSNVDGVLDVSDAIHLIGVMITGVGRERCREASDANDNGLIDVADAMLILHVLFRDPSGRLPHPGAPPRPCAADGRGPDATVVGCEEYDACGSA